MSLLNRPVDLADLLSSSQVGSYPQGYFKAQNGVIVNPYQKPLLQLEFLIRTCMVPEADFVVDLCCGSGSGCVAAVRIGYNAYGIDRSTEQVHEAKRRLNMFMIGEAA